MGSTRIKRRVEGKWRTENWQKLQRARAATKPEEALPRPRREELWFAGPSLRRQAGLRWTESWNPLSAHTLRPVLQATCLPETTLGIRK